MNKKAFTLIELLAVIIIIGIIAVITIPKINESLESSRKNVAKTSAYEYKKAVSEKYYQKIMNKENVTLNGEYTVDNTGTLTGTNNSFIVDFSGTKPKEGKLYYVSGELTNGCIVIGNYAIIFEEGNVTSTSKGNCDDYEYVDSNEPIVTD